METFFPKIEIPGVNAETGFAIYGGEPDFYINVLRSYVPNALKLMEKMRVVSEETLQNYTAAVHGLAGISASIGAENLKEAAHDLESKAKSGDLAGVLAGNEAFLEDAALMVSGVKAWLKEHDSRDSRPVLPHPDRQLLVRLRKCCEAFDMNGVDSALDELEKSNYEYGSSLVKWLRERADESDFFSIVERLLSY